MKKNVKWAVVACAAAGIVAAACAMRALESVLGGRDAVEIAVGSVGSLLAAAAAFRLYRAYQDAAAARVEWETAIGKRDSRGNLKGEAEEADRVEGE